MRRLFGLLLVAATAASVSAKTFDLMSPDKNISVIIDGDARNLTVAACADGDTVLSPSPISLILSDGTVVGPSGNIRVAGHRSVDEMIPSPFYRASELRDNFNELTLRVARDWDLVVRAYNDGMAYRFVTRRKTPFEIADETAALNFPTGSTVTTPYTNSKGKTIAEQYRNSFENTYTTVPLSEMDRSRLSFLPLVVTTPSGERVMISESALENYPGMYLIGDTEAPDVLQADFAPVPRHREQGGHNNLQMLTTEREDFIARVEAPRAFPWRMMVIAKDDVTLAATNMTYLLGEPSRLADTSWIKPGKVAWDWWNAWNITGVPFKSGVNNDTYKAYIDFASENGIEYVILDEGWAVNKQADLMQVVPEIDIPMLVEYAGSKGVGLILWAGYVAFDRDMENVCRHYADMGIKGFKVDFMDHDDQLITDFNYRAAETAARHNLLIDLHGTSKPAGLNRTWPNVVNFEGVFGLEQMKWAPESTDMVYNDLMIPFLRQAAGPLDYTQGAMKNASKGNYRPVYTDPMSQGTRCRQLALYMIFDSPLTMLCDTPDNYTREPESTAFIAATPTVWDETRVLTGKMGEYIVTARRSGDEWWIGGITDWNPREITLDLSFIPDLGGATVEMMTDGVNADRNGRDYKRTKTTGSALGATPTMSLAPGGGFAMRITPSAAK